MRITRLLVSLIVVMMVWSCSQKSDSVIAEPIDSRVDLSMSRTIKDTLELSALVERYLTCVKYGDYDAATAMISVYNDSTKTLEVPSDSILNKLKVQYQSFPMIRFSIDEINLYSETDTEVRYTVEMFECEEGENIPNTMGFMLLPKRIDGVWYLCVGGRSIIR